MELEFEVSNQSLVRTDSVGVVNQSVNYLSCVFTFKTTDWSGFNKYVLFKSESGENYCYSLGTECEVECTVPAKVLEHDLFRLTLFGLKDEERITTNLVTVKLVRSGFSTSIQSYEGDGTGDIFSDWVELLSDYILKSDTPGLVKNDGTIDTRSFALSTHNHGAMGNSGTINNTANEVNNILVTNNNHQIRTIDVLPWNKLSITKANITGLGVSEDTHTHSYGDLTGKPDFIEKSNTNGFVLNDGTIDTRNFALSNHTHGAIGNGGTINYDISDVNKVVVTTSLNQMRTISKLPFGNLNISKANITGLGIAEENHTHSYNDLTNKPTIPSDVADLTDNSNTAFTPKSHTHGNITNDGKVGSDPNYFVYTTANGAITSKQKIGNISINGTIGTNSGLPIITGAYGVLTTGSFGTTSGTFAEGNHTHSDYVNPTIVDNLTTDDATQVLSAKQGKVLKDLIGDAITYINQ